MEIYWELLNENGYNISKKELNIKTLDNKETYKNLKINLDKTWYELKYTMDYKQEQEYQFKKIHRYCRKLRFKNQLYHLVGIKGNIEIKDLNEIKKCIGKKLKTSPTRCYNIVYKFLKFKKWRKYYISIPYIIKIITGKKWIIKNKYFLTSYEMIKFIENQFICLNYIFNLKFEILERKRFPKLQYIALRLLDDIEIYPPYHIPFARTIKKRKSLNPLYIKLVDLVWEYIHSV